MTKREKIKAYKKLAIDYFENPTTWSFVCNDLMNLCGVQYEDDLNIPELKLFSYRKINKSSYDAWLSPNNMDVSKCMQIKSLILLFGIEILKDGNKKKV